MASYRLPAPTSMAFYGRPSLPFARPKTLQTLQTPKTPKRPLPWLLIGFQRPHPLLFMGVQAIGASSAGKSPHPSLFMGVQACRLPGLEPSKPLQSHFNCFLWASSAGNKFTSMAFYGRPSLPFARPKTLQTLQTLQTPKTPKRQLQWLLIGFQRPHPWLFMGVQACRLPGLKRSNPSKPLKPLKGNFHGFL